MSEKELAIKLINSIPEYKIGYAVAFLQGLYADEKADDDFCISLIENYKKSNDKGEFMSFEEVMKICEVSVDAVQN
ncbi:MAG: hypothetical protein IJN88_09290 [Clostridia bacterium]|nr:hypothetical protein [Clostridia bacterium]